MYVEKKKGARFWVKGGIMFVTKPEFEGSAFWI